MKSLWNGACVALLLSVSALAHAQGVPGTPGAAPADTAQQAAPAQVSDANVQLTRAQVYQQLVQAEQDGQLQTLNSTVYAHQ
jgi:hypothetical protein